MECFSKKSYKFFKKLISSLFNKNLIEKLNLKINKKATNLLFDYLAQVLNRMGQDVRAAEPSQRRFQDRKD